MCDNLVYLTTSTGGLLKIRVLLQVAVEEQLDFPVLDKDDESVLEWATKVCQEKALELSVKKRWKLLDGATHLIEFEGSAYSKPEDRL